MEFEWHFYSNVNRNFLNEILVVTLVGRK